MIFVYNFLQVTLLAATFPLLLLIVLGKEKYRVRIGSRLGRGLKKKISGLRRERKKLIWVHSLSVGEVTSALPLVRGLREEMDNVCVVFSATTTTGMDIAREKIAPHVDLVVASPLDLLFVVNRFIRLIRPDMFILVETDFWPNWLYSLRKKSVPMLLVNGRISRTSFARYRRFSFFFRDLFRSFTLLSMQTENDAKQMSRLGVSPQRIKTLGNLKYDTLLFSGITRGDKPFSVDQRIPETSRTWICGSTHPGEEEMILTAFSGLLQTCRDIFLIIAPRDPGRGGEIQQLAADRGLKSMRRTSPADPIAPILVLDTIGELAECYRLARVAFIGGSLADFGGHNPLEAAACGVPVLFGPHMDDFQEIARDLADCGGAVVVDTPASLETSVARILKDGQTHAKMSKAALDLVESHAGVIMNHIHEIDRLLAGEPSRG